MKNGIKNYDNLFKRSFVFRTYTTNNVHGSDSVFFHSQRNDKPYAVSLSEVISLSTHSFSTASWDRLPRLSSRFDDFRSLVCLYPYLHKMQKQTVLECPEL